MEIVQDADAGNAAPSRYAGQVHLIGNTLSELHFQIQEIPCHAGKLGRSEQSVSQKKVESPNFLTGSV